LYDVIRKHPLCPDHIHIWEFEIPKNTLSRNSVPDDKRTETISHFSKRISYQKPCRVLRRGIIAEYLDRDPAEIHIKHEKSGKPVLEKSPIPVFLSTSYTTGAWILGLSRGNALGIDIEYMKNDNRLLTIAERFFYPEEWIFIRSLPEDEQMKAFFHLWTLKEAYLKAIGTGFPGWHKLPEMAYVISDSPAADTVFPLLHTPYKARILMSDGTCQALVFKKIT
jgi:4'-phosphopantetheinyl transferase